MWLDKVWNKEWEKPGRVSTLFKGALDKNDIISSISKNVEIFYTIGSVSNGNDCMLILTF